MNRERLIWIGVILLILAIAVWIGRRDGRKLEQLRNQSELLERQVRDLSTARDVALSRAKVESEQRTKFVMASDSEQAALKAQIRRLKNRLVKQADGPGIVAPTPAESSDTTTVAGCADQDSVIFFQDKLITSLELEQTAVTDSFNKQLSIMDSALLTQKSISDAWEGHAKSVDKKLKRQRFWTKFWRSVGIGAVVAGGVIAVTSQ